MIGYTDAKQWTPEIAAEYADLWRTAEIRPEWAARINQAAARVLANRGRYEAAAASASGAIPWVIPACAHMLECGGDFARQILNGQRWDQKTTITPKGRGPFDSWEAAAVEGLRRHGLHFVEEWTLSRVLYALECWNGLGYRVSSRRIWTPYLWSGTNHYTAGKFTADGKYSAAAVSKQTGAAAILMWLDRFGALRIDNAPRGPLMRYRDQAPTDDAERRIVRIMQIALRDALLRPVAVDGWAGQETALAVFDVCGQWIDGTPDRVKQKRIGT